MKLYKADKQDFSILLIFMMYFYVTQPFNEMVQEAYWHLLFFLPYIY